jgi:hypothetical protein
MAEQFRKYLDGEVNIIQEEWEFLLVCLFDITKESRLAINE